MARSLYRFLILLSLFTLKHALVFAQADKVYWASEVLEVSSEKKLSHHIYELHPLAYKAVQ
ncbi:MAG: hypothetical protein KDC99_08460, partial [Cyclobacteriaceae bacterium]|nr:hypothetical protein [Cyclobacteriaceae bacterium]